MNYQTMLATVGGLLHDVGKLAYRAGGPNLNHSRRGFDFLRDCWHDKPDSPARQTVLDCVLYHHQDALKETDLPPDSLAWLVYYADNVSAAADRRPEDDSASGVGVRPKQGGQGLQFQNSSSPSSGVSCAGADLSSFFRSLWSGR